MSRATLDLGIIGNGSVSALIDGGGRIVWCCLPTFDADPVFCDLLSPELDGGYFDVELHEEKSRSQRYLDNTAILVTRLEANDGGMLEITDFAPRYKQFGRVFHPMSVVRRIRPLAGTPRIRLCLRPLTGYGARAPDHTSGSNHLRFLLDGLVLRATTDAPLPMLEQGLSFLLDREICVVLGPDETLQDAPARYVHEALEATRAYWRDWVRYLSLPVEWQDAVIRAAITLKMCQHEGTGAIVAAMTTSIPEAAGTVRNWDYRHCWLRDATFVVRALNRLGATRSMEEYLRFLFNLAVSSDDELAPVYGIHFERELVEGEAKHLRGYRGMGPVRIGNDAWRQRQHDVYGSVVLAATQLFFDHRLESRGGEAAFARLEPAGEAAWRLHDQPDAGLWEYRNRTSVHTYSAVMCWAACNRLARIAEHLGLDRRAAHWADRAHRVRETILERAVHADGYFSDVFDGDRLDASLLLLPELGFIDAHDARYRATVEAVGRVLLHNDHLFRYAAADDFGLPETSFTICSFWYVDALDVTGRRDLAREQFERLLARRNPLGLLSEDIDTANGELWGNFPQTYSLVGLINSAMRLSRPWEDVL
jgi:GH15 family glucan-1,4-alpha-glucosidase